MEIESRKQLSSQEKDSEDDFNREVKDGLDVPSLDYSEPSSDDETNIDESTESKWIELDIDDHIPDVFSEWRSEDEDNLEIIQEETGIDEFFKLFPIEMINQIKISTNNYAKKKITNGLFESNEMEEEKFNSEPQDGFWKPVTLEEMQSFIACNLLMGIVQKPSLTDYWSTDPLT